MNSGIIIIIEHSLYESFKNAEVETNSEDFNLAPSKGTSGNPATGPTGTRAPTASNLNFARRLEN